MIDSTEDLLQQRAYDDYNPEIEGNESYNKDRYRTMRWVDKQMAVQAQSFLMENRAFED